MSQILEIENIDEKMKEVKKMAEQYKLKKFDLTILKKANDTDYFDRETYSLIKFLGEISKTNKLKFKEIGINYLENIYNLKKLNKQLKTIIIASNIKLSNLGLNKNNKYKALPLLLKTNIVLPSVCSSISGLTVIQILHMLNDSDFIDFIKSKKKDIVIENQIIDDIKNEENLNKVIMNPAENNIFMYKNIIFNFASNLYISYDIVN